MESDEPPSDYEFYNPIFKTYKRDLEMILLKPDSEKKELAVLNPSVFQDSEKAPWPFIYRVEMQDKIGRFSLIKYRKLLNPARLSEKEKIIIQPEYDYELRGCEDPRITKIKDLYYITYVAFDGINARVALATTKNFKKIKKHGIISPQIELKKAIDIVGEELYKKVWHKKYKETGEKLKEINLNKFGLQDKKQYLWDKDAIITYDFKIKKWMLFHRLEPNIHIAVADKLEDLKNQDFWEDYLKNIAKHTLMKTNEKWESEKIGLGGPLFNIGDKKIGLYHGVSPDLTYSGSFIEIDSKNSKKVVSKLKNPLFKPENEDYIFKDETGAIKKVVFPTGAIIQGNSLFVYSGIGDTKIGVRSTDINWLYNELNHPSNRISY